MEVTTPGYIGKLYFLLLLALTFLIFAFIQAEIQFYQHNVLLQADFSTLQSDFALLHAYFALLQASISGNDAANKHIRNHLASINANSAVYLQPIR